MAPNKILIVDDEEVIHRTLIKVLKSPSVQTLSALDGADALRLAEDEHPDLILLDVNMPKMNGNEVMRALRKSKKTCGIPVIMLTGNGEVIDRMVGFELGVQDYVTKPFAVEDLRNRVEPYIGKRRTK